MNNFINSWLYLLLTTLSATTIILSIATSHYYNLYYTLYETSEETIEQLKNQTNVQNETISTLNQELHTVKHISVKLIAGSFALLATIISVMHMGAHLRHFNRPEVQRKILGKICF